MAKLVGTGTDPLGRFPKGHIFDSAADSLEFRSLLESGVAEMAGPAPGHHGEKRRVELANAVVRGDNAVASSAADREILKEFEPDEDGNVQTDAAEVVHSDGGVFPVPEGGVSPEYVDSGGEDAIAEAVAGEVGAGGSATQPNPAADETAGAKPDDAGTSEAAGGEAPQATTTRSKKS